MTSIGTTLCSAYAESALGEVQCISGTSANTVEGKPFDVLSIHAALQQQIFKQPPDFVVHYRGRDCRAHPETPPKASRDIVFATAF